MCKLEDGGQGREEGGGVMLYKIDQVYFQFFIVNKNLIKLCFKSLLFLVYDIPWSTSSLWSVINREEKQKLIAGERRE